MVKPADGPSSHCTGVRALSRLIACSAGRTSSARASPAPTVAAQWLTDSMSRNCSIEVNGKLAIPISSPWYTYGVPRCRCRTVASIFADSTRNAPSSPKRETTRGWSWLSQYRLFQPDVGEAGLPAPERGLEVAQVERAHVPLVDALVELDVLELEHHVDLAAAPGR